MFLIILVAAYRQRGAGNDKGPLGLVFQDLGPTFINAYIIKQKS